MQCRSLVVGIQLERAIEMCARRVPVAEPKVPQSHHVPTVDSVIFVEVLVKYQEVRQRYGKIVHLYVVIEMLLAVLDERLEDCRRLLGFAKLLPRQPLVKYHLRRLVVVVHRRGWLVVPLSRLFEPTPRLLVLAEAFVRTAKVVEDVVLLRDVEFALAQIRRIVLGLGEEVDCMLEGAL
jgi:hypothetical protein